MIAFGFSPLSHFYLEKLIGLSKELGELGIPGMQIAIFLPIITSLLNFYRGSLSAVKRTLPITIGTILEVTGISLILILGQIFSAPGIQTAALALTFGILIDTILLYLYYRKTTKDA
jgi:Na+-driven multidrug efflux pump